jgi:general stress protein 26
MSTLTFTKAETDKLESLISDIGVAMIVTKAPDGSLHSRPMAFPKHAFDGDLWFFTAEHSLKANEVSHESQVNVAFSEPKNERYVSISGRATIVQDHVRAREMWNPLLKGWFPQGPDDPTLALLRVEIEHAEYWDAKSSKMLVFFSLVKASLTSKEPKHLGQHENLG